MRVLIVGTTSALGSAVCADLVEQGLDVVTAGRHDAEIPLDLSQADIPALDSVDVVANFAAATGRPGESAELGWRVNVDGARVLARLAVAAGARRLVQLSTAYAAHPRSYPGPAWYAESKAAGDRELQRFLAASGVDLTVLRPTHVYDAEGRCRANQELPYHFADLAEAGSDIEVHGTGRSRRDYLHLDDLVRAVRRCVTTSLAGVHLLASPGARSLLEIAHAAQRAFDSPGQVRLRSDRPDPPDTPDLNHRGWHALGLEPEVDLDTGFALMRSARAEVKAR